MKIYLDVCCLNRPFDEQSQARVRLEAEAVALILGIIDEGEWEWVSSEAVDFEIDQMPDVERKAAVQSLITTVNQYITIQQAEEVRARQLDSLGFRPLDALHIACAESSGADVFLTTDDRLLNLASRLSAQIHVQVANPLPWLGGIER
jgi:predicted nucleic acid-binding protein